MAKRNNTTASVLSNWGRRLAQLPVHFFQRAISPYLPHVCRFRPTCSDYALEALHDHGPIRGFVLIVWRLLRCHPFSRGGYDPVPPGRTHD